MNILKAIGAFFGMLLMGMMGGQGKIGGKNTRRWGLPAIATWFAVSWDGFQWKDLVYLLFIPILMLGYGQNSHLYNICFSSDTITRVVYALLLALPFLFWGWIRAVIAGVSLIIAFQVHAGSLGSTSWFGDFLIEDICRYSTLALLVIGNTIWRPKK